MFDMLKDNNVIMDGHWKLASGRHAKLYVNKDRAYCNPYIYHTIIDEMTHKIQNSGIMAVAHRSSRGEICICELYVCK